MVKYFQCSKTYTKRRKNMKKKLLAILCVVALLIPMAAIPASAAREIASNWLTNSNTLNFTGSDYSFVVLGDIQAMTRYDVEDDSTHLKSIFDWIQTNKESRNIQYVIGLGDSVDTIKTSSSSTHTKNKNEWELAAAQINRLGVNGDINIPYSIIRGNHDDETGYHNNICTTDYQNQMSGFYYDSTKAANSGNSMSNSYRKITIGGTKYLMLNLDYKAYNDANVIAWANSVIAANPSYRVIASVHAYLNGGYEHGFNKLDTSTNPNGFYTDVIGDSKNGTTAIINYEYDGSAWWNNVFSKHENMFMVLCGHDATPTPLLNQRTGANGNTVFELLVDTSWYDWGKDKSEIYSSGALMVLNFDEDNNKLHLEYIAPEQSNKQIVIYGYAKTTRISDSYYTISKPTALSYNDIPEVIMPTTLETASTRISKENSGLRFKTTISEDELQHLIDTYGADNVSVGTLIAPTDKLGSKALTHSFGKVNVDYIDVKANINTPFSKENGVITYAGSISNIMQKNLGRNFTAVGYIAYVDGGKPYYIYSDTTATRSVDYVATKALNDTEANYSYEMLAILEQLTVAYWNNIYKDPFEKDPF